MNELLDKFENIVILMTIFDNQNLNYITESTLNELIDTASELNIDLNCIDLEKKLNENQILDIFYEWIEDLNAMYLDTKIQILKSEQNDV